MSFSDRIDNEFTNLSLVDSTNLEGVFSSKTLQKMAFKGKKKNESSSPRISLLTTSAKVSEISPTSSPLALKIGYNSAGKESSKTEVLSSGKSRKNGKKNNREDKYRETEEDSNFDDISSIALLKNDGAPNNDEEDDYEDEQGSLRLRHSTKKKSVKISKYQVFGTWTPDHEKYLRKYKKFKRNWARIFEELWLSTKLLILSQQSCQNGVFLIALGMACSLIIELLRYSPKYNFTILLVLLAGEKFPYFPLKSVKPQIVIAVATGISVFLDIWYVLMAPEYIRYSLLVMLCAIIIAKALALFRYLNNARGTLRARKYLIRRVRLFIVSTAVPKRIMRDVRARILAIGWIQLFSVLAFGILFTLSITAFGYNILFVSATNGIPLHLFLLIKAIISSILFVAIYSDVNTVVCLSYFGCLGFWMSYVKSYLRNYKTEFGGWPYPYSFNVNRFQFITIGKAVDFLWGLTGWITVAKQLGRKWTSMDTNLRTFLSIMVLIMFISDIYCSALFYCVHWLRNKYDQNLLLKEDVSESDDSELDELNIRKRKSDSPDLPTWMKNSQDEFISSDEDDNAAVSRNLLNTNISVFLDQDDDDDDDDDDDGVVDEFLRLKKGKNKNNRRTYKEYERDWSDNHNNNNDVNNGSINDSKIVEFLSDDVESGLLRAEQRKMIKSKKSKKEKDEEEVTKLVEALMDGDEDMDVSTHYRDNESKTIEVKVKSRKNKEKKKKQTIDEKCGDDEDNMDKSMHYRDNENKTIEIKVKSRKNKNNDNLSSNNNENSDSNAAVECDKSYEGGVNAVSGNIAETTRSTSSKKANGPELNLDKLSTSSFSPSPNKASPNVDINSLAAIAEYGDGFYLVTTDDPNSNSIKHSLIAPGENPNIHGLSMARDILLIGKSDCIRTAIPTPSIESGRIASTDGIILDATCEIEKKAYRKLWKSISIDSASFTCNLKSLTKFSDDKEYLSYISSHLKVNGHFITASECLSSRKLGVYLFSVGYTNPKDPEPMDVRSRLKLLQARLDGQMKPIYCLMYLSFTPVVPEGKDFTSTDPSSTSSSPNSNTLNELMDMTTGYYAALNGPQSWVLECTVRMTDKEFASDFIAELNLGGILEIID